MSIILRLVLLIVNVSPYIAWLSKPYNKPRSICIKMSDPDGLIETMRKTLGEKNDVSELAESQSKELMKGLKELDRDPNMRVNNKFLEWLDFNGVWVKSQSTWGRAQHPLVIRIYN